MFFLKRLPNERDEKIGSMCWVCFRVGRRVFLTCKLLCLGSNTQDYDWTLHSNSLFNPFCCKRVWNIYKCFEWKTNTRAYKLLRLGLVFWTMARHYTKVVFFFQFIMKGRRIWIFGIKQAFGLENYYGLGLTLGMDYDWTLHPGNLFLPLLLKIVKIFKLVILNLFEKIA